MANIAAITVNGAAQTFDHDTIRSHPIECGTNTSIGEIRARGPFVKYFKSDFRIDQLPTISYFIGYPGIGMLSCFTGKVNGM